ncbi:SAM-dependent methyltransferase, partial [Burkholderia multivorans]
MSDGSYSTEVISGGYLPIDEEASVRANRSYWDNSAEEYLAENGSFLGASDFMWCTEGIHESDVPLLGPVARKQ